MKILNHYERNFEKRQLNLNQRL